MGQPQPKEKKPTIEEVILDMKMTAKRFEMESRRAEKDKNKEIAKARQAIKKGNEEGARLFLAGAATKQKEQQQLLRMANKMDAMSTTIKSNTSNVSMIGQLNKITPLLAYQAESIPVDKIYNDMETFEKAMDDILVSGKVMDGVLNQKYQDSNSDLAVDNMLTQMKKEMYNDVQAGLNPNAGTLFNDLAQPNAFDSNKAQKDNEFMNDLKK